MDRPATIDVRQNGAPNTRVVQSPHAGNIHERDMTQTSRLHEPTSISSHTDPINGHDVMGTAGHPFVIDGILTAYFESAETRRIYLDSPYSHPVGKLPGEASAEDDRGG